MATTEAFDLSRFCDVSENYRYLLNTPWVKGGFRYATDCRIMVVEPTEDPDTVPPEDKSLPNAALVVESFSSVVCDIEWPETFAACPSCGQTGTQQVWRKVCAECNGEGVHECDLGFDHECVVCRGKGVKESSTQFVGAGLHFSDCEDEACAVHFGGFFFSRRRVVLLGTLPRPMKVGFQDVEGGAMVVQCENGLRGILMGIKRGG